MKCNAVHPFPKEELLRYKGVHIVEQDKYLYEFCPAHPKANKWGHIQQHRLVVELHLGRFLTTDESVHHIDLNPHNNSIENLVVLSRSEHYAIHRKLEREAKYPPLTHELVKQKLSEGGLKAAARALGCNQETIRNNFPDLVAPYKRKSPAILDDPKWVEQLRDLAADENVGYREASRILGISVESIGHILRRNNIQWVRKSKAGEEHTKYIRKGNSYEYPPELVDQIRQLASDPNCSYNDASLQTGLSTSKLQRIASQYDIQWIAKSNRSYPVSEE